MNRMAFKKIKCPSMYSGQTLRQAQYELLDTRQQMPFDKLRTPFDSDLLACMSKAERPVMSEARRACPETEGACHERRPTGRSRMVEVAGVEPDNIPSLIFRLIAVIKGN